MRKLLLAVLVGLVRSEGVWLANAVLVMDVCANWWGNRHWLQDGPARLRRLALYVEGRGGNKK